MYLLDTDVVSELRKRKRDVNVDSVDRARRTGRFVSLERDGLRDRVLGIERRRRDDPAFAQDLANWLDTTLRLYGERILPLTINIARRWGRLAAQIGNRNLDLAIAATAFEHGLAVATRNVAHYEMTGVGVVNPFETTKR